MHARRKPQNILILNKRRSERLGKQPIFLCFCLCLNQPCFGRASSCDYCCISLALRYLSGLLCFLFLLLNG